MQVRRRPVTVHPIGFSPRQYYNNNITGAYKLYIICFPLTRDFVSIVLNQLYKIVKRSAVKNALRFAWYMDIADHTVEIHSVNIDE